VSGDGPLDLAFLNSGLPIDLLSEDAGFVRVRRRLGTFSRTLWFDRRGLGASEGDPRDNLVGEISPLTSSPCSTPWASSDRRWWERIHPA
jgi:hypothetical protein